MLGVGVSEDGGDSWQPTFGFSMWEIADFTFHPTDPNVIWVGTLGGPYVSVDGGHHWEPRRAGLPPIARDHFSAPIQKILFHPRNPDRLLAFGGFHCNDQLGVLGKPRWGAVWQSDDGGRSWKQIATIADGSRAANIVSAGFAGGQADSLYVALRGSGVYLSTDGGTTWTTRNDGLPQTSNLGRLVVHPARKEVLWLALGQYRRPGDKEFQPGGVYKSSDGGRTWHPAQNGLKLQSHKNASLASHYRTIAVSPTHPDVLLTCDFRSWGHYDYRDVDGRRSILWGPTTFKSMDGGGSWRLVLTHPAESQGCRTAYSALANSVIEFDPRNAERAFLGSSMSLLRTADGGQTWTDATSYQPDPDQLESWRGRGYSGLCSGGFAFNPSDPNHAVLLGLDDAFWQSRDRLRTWRRVERVESGMAQTRTGSDVTFAGEGGRVIYVILGQYDTPFAGIGKSTDGGQSWKDLFGPAHGLPERSAAGQGHPPDQAIAIYALPHQPNVVWATIAGKLYHSIDGGEQWRVIHEGPGLFWIAALPDDPRSFYLSGAEGVYFTKDGKTFDRLLGSPGSNPWFPGHIAVDRSRPPRLYVASWSETAGQGGLWRWSDGVWTRLHDGPAVAGVAVDPTDPKRIAIATADSPRRDVTVASGIWISEDGGQTWSQQNEGLPCLRGRVLAFNPHDPEQLVFGSSGRGYFVARWPQR